MPKSYSFFLFILILFHGMESQTRLSIKRASFNQAATTTSERPDSTSRSGPRLPVDNSINSRDEGILRQNAHHFRFYPLDVGDPFFLHQQFCGLHRTEQTRGSFPLPGLKIFVTGTHGQAIRFANDGTNHNLNREIQIGDHFLKHDDLLGILLAKGDKIGQTKIEELCANGRHSPKMRGAGLAAQAFPDVFLRYESRIAGWIHLRIFGSKNQIHLPVSQSSRSRFRSRGYFSNLPTPNWWVYEMERMTTPA